MNEPDTIIAAVKAIRTAMANPYIRAVSVRIFEHEILLTDYETLRKDDKELGAILKSRLDRKREITKQKLIEALVPPEDA